jgi:hypothetical protein
MELVSWDYMKIPTEWKNESQNQFISQWEG